jgi:rod shape-determining protein MreC
MSTSPNTSLGKRRITVRRGVIAALIAVCLLLMTVYFRESTGGTLHGVQDAAGGVLSPVESVAVKAVRPFQDAWGWTTGLVDARNRAEDLERENVRLRGLIVDNKAQAEELARLRALTGVMDGDLPRGYRALAASVLNKSPNNWYSRGRLDVGRNQGVMVNSPVVSSADRGAALVGVITSVTAGSSVVTFITDSRTVVGATVLGAGNPPGILQATTDGQLRLDKVPREYKVEKDDIVVTAGFSADNLPSVYPPNLFVGQVEGVGKREVDAYYTIQVAPLVDVRSLADVVVLTPRSAEAKRRARG